MKILAGPGENVVGLAHFCRGAGEAQRHIAQLDFFVHDNFLERTELLLQKTMEESGRLSVPRLYCHCLECDEIKRGIVEALGGKRIALLRENVLLPDRCANVLVYELWRVAATVRAPYLTRCRPCSSPSKVPTEVVSSA